MKQEDKDLLLKYLCMALPYGVKLKKDNEDNSAVELYSINLEHEAIQYWSYKSSSLQIGGYGYLVRYDKLQFKPYLRPMSSMTTEEDRIRIDLGIWKSNQYDDQVIGIFQDIAYVNPLNFQSALIWLLQNHFDIFGLIPKGLALEAPKGMYNS